MRVSNRAVALAPKIDILKVLVFYRDVKIVHAEVNKSIKFLYSLS